eukprot:4332081-Prorocentrum_lima.AAC.1
MGMFDGSVYTGVDAVEGSQHPARAASNSTKKCSRKCSSRLAVGFADGIDTVEEYVARECSDMQ